MLEAMKDGVIIALLFSLCALIGVVIGRLLAKKTPKTVGVKEKRESIVFTSIDGKFVLLEVDKIKQIEELDGEKTLIYYGHNVKSGEPARTYVVNHPFYQVVFSLEKFNSIKFVSSGAAREYRSNNLKYFYSELHKYADKHFYSELHKYADEQGEETK